MSYYSPKYTTLLGKITMFFVVWQFIWALMSYPIASGLIVFVCTACPMFPLLFRRHEDILAENNDAADFMEYVMKIVLPSVLGSIIFGWLTVHFVSPPPLYPKELGKDFFDFLFFAITVCNLWFLIVYFLNTYLRYRGFDTMLIRVVICVVVGFILLFPVGVLLHNQLAPILPQLQEAIQNMANSAALPNETP